MSEQEIDVLLQKMDEWHREGWHTLISADYPTLRDEIARLRSRLEKAEALIEAMDACDQLLEGDPTPREIEIAAEACDAARRAWEES